MKVWRIEDEHGVGMHRKLVAEPQEDELFAPTAFTMATMMHDWTPYDNDLAVHTDPNNDERLMAALGDRSFDNYIFGFKTPKQMRNWVYKDTWIQQLDKFGLLVALYFVEEGLLVGDSQVMIPKDCSPYETYPIAEYFGVKPLVRPGQ